MRFFLIFASLLSVFAAADVISQALLASASTVTSSAVSFATTNVFTTATVPLTMSTASCSQPTQSAATGAQDINLIRERRLTSIVSELSGSSNVIAGWLSSLDSDGKWPDVDYATGCAAQRANWPARDHWVRLLTMAGAWHGGLSGVCQYIKDANLESAILLGMRWWFDHDFTNPACLDNGGSASCPCNSTETLLWNTNWYNILTEADESHCMLMSTRSYGAFARNASYMTGANILDVAKIGIDAGLLSSNESFVADAYSKIHQELGIKDGIMVDGIRSDGSFGQHGGLLYNGNYGTVYSNDVLDLELAAAGTQFSAGSASKTALASLFDGDKWMIFYNAINGVLHWDFSVLPRFISFPVIDGQATADIGMNLTAVEELGNEWMSNTLIEFGASLNVTDLAHANAGNLNGNRMFYANDYMVHRGKRYVTTLKMFSSRTKNTECTNSENPFGFHLADGVLYTYLNGNEYEDIAAAWDWSLIPGITVDYNATILSCSSSQFSGLQAFVGGVSNGQVGVAAMRYLNPSTKSLGWQKAWFFLEDDVQHVMVANISSNTNAPVYSVLDQKRYVEPLVVDEYEDVGSMAGPRSLWHGNVGYVIDPQESTSISFSVEDKRGNWSSIGISTQPPSDVTLFTAWLQHDSLNSSSSYTAFPGTTLDTFLSKSHQFSLQSAENDAQVSAIYDQAHETVFAIFWNESGGSTKLDISCPQSSEAHFLSITANGNIALIYDQRTNFITVSDPSQTLTAVEITFVFTRSEKEALTRSSVVAFPTGGLAGSSVFQRI
ncbi:polysaccharide lyase family 8 protein [Guyanagaster necrorhizus]|uniref:Polysaccharide lyase family 8 protein n=1 Tax=Guyanagaster necrorhizus TaxID=856835 RepID=A0A9P8AWE3_9AGAR|nr:polysaccharide lyase family 8 protein [Guyanagaster necrorhizus MCA 3950]KAG7450483.1 polysaccharide lyase family 8 protein [Guyanagaster necrorhizus MCA 3950]